MQMFLNMCSFKLIKYIFLFLHSIFTFCIFRGVCQKERVLVQNQIQSSNVKKLTCIYALINSYVPPPLCLSLSLSLCLSIDSKKLAILLDRWLSYIEVNNTSNGSHKTLGGGGGFFLKKN